MDESARMTLTKLREIAMAATQVRWKYVDEQYGAKCVIGMKPEDDRWIAHCQPELRGRSNGKHIATFDPTMVLKLLDCVEALEFYAEGHDHAGFKARQALAALKETT